MRISDGSSDVCSSDLWDCDIVEMHHTRKLDAPSGTALALGAAAEKPGAAPRYASLRAGDIVGEHLVQFATDGERIELVHRAGNRDIFARGALHAALALAGQIGRTPLWTPVTNAQH